jgi:membrane protein DedA with SNARE-associated domain
MAFEILSFNIPNFSEYIKLFGYLGIFLFFITVDQLTFIPEEITLLTIGYLASQGVFNPVIAGIISFTAFVAVDVAYFYFTKKGVKFTKRLQKKKGTIRKKVEEKLKKNFPKTLLILCFIPRMRMWAPIISGALNIPIKKFLIYDTISLVLFTGIYISLGMIFHRGLHSLLSHVKTWQHIIFAVLMLVVGIFIFINVRKYYKEKNEN